MDSLPHAHELRTKAYSKMPGPNSSPILNQRTPIKPLREVSVGIDEENSSHSQSPSLTTGSSRTSSVYSASENGSTSLIREPSTHSRTCRRTSDAESPLWRQEEEDVQLHRWTDNPRPSWQINMLSIPRHSSPLSFCHAVGPESEVSAQPAESLSKNTLTLRRKDDTSLPTMQSGFQPLSGEGSGGSGNDTTDEDSASAQGMPYFESESMDSSADSTEESDEDSEDDDNGWSERENGQFEAAILQAVFPDLELAAHLITHLYSMIYSGSSKKVSRKVSLWRERLNTCATDSGTTSTGKPPSSTTTAKRQPQKRERLTSSPGTNNDEEEDEDEDESDRRSKRLKEDHDTDMVPTPKLACPFFKKNPVKYCAQTQKYRVCAGPGFRTHGLLKEHLKRKHHPVQCDRCYQIFKFKGKDRSSAVEELGKHRRSDDLCVKNPESMREGISDAQWSNLEEKKQTKKGKSFIEEKPKSDVDKWNDIWKVLFPDVPPPPTPWYDGLPTDIHPHPSQGLHRFLDVHEQTLEHMLPNIKRARTDAELRLVLSDLARKVFQVWSTTLRWNDGSTTTFSRSGQSNRQSATSWELVRPPSQQQLSVAPHPPLFSNSTADTMQTQFMSSGIVGDNAEPSFDQRLTPYANNNSTPVPVKTLSSVNNGYGLDGLDEMGGWASGHDTFQQGGYAANTTSMGNGAWVNPIGFNAGHASFDNVSMAGGMGSPTDFDMDGASMVTMQRMDSSWNQYPRPDFPNKRDAGQPSADFGQL